MTVTWRADFEIGVLEIDGQHREIFSRFDRLLQAIAAGKGKEEVIRTLNFLDQYSREHFACEEALQQHSAYPYFEMHRAEHRYFVAAMDGIHAKYVVSGVQDAMVKQTCQLLQEWLITHICTIDRALAPFLVSHPLVE